MNILAYICFGIGVFFNFVGCIGLIRMPDLYCRLQASTKNVTFGIGWIFLGLILGTHTLPVAVKSILCVSFIFFTAPTAAHALARAAHLAGVKLWKGSIKDSLEEDFGTKESRYRERLEKYVYHDEETEE
ncbi:MAG: monovalent cation/H(+) antiporter subunit G [Candidatus Omnitrophota bacterium]